MSQPQIPDVTTVSDSVLGRSIQMPTADALDAIKRFPARYSFAAGDPRNVPATVPVDLEGRLKPTITGSKGGNAAVASVVAALVALGLAVDTTS
jgi:hypothetical protein